MSKTIQELEIELKYARRRGIVEGTTEVARRVLVDRLCATQEKLTAQKYEAIIEERVQETVKQRLEKPQKGDFVMVAIERQKAGLRADVEALVIKALAALDKRKGRSGAKTLLQSVLVYLEVPRE